MSFYVDIDPLKAMEIFYDGEKLGVWEGEFIKNENKRGLIYPPKLKEFLLKFGFFGVNGKDSRFWFPDDVSIVGIDTGMECKDMLILGKIGELYAGVFADDCGMDDPPISLGMAVENEDGAEVLSFRASDLYLRDLLICLFTGNLAYEADPEVYEDAIEIKSVLYKYRSDPLLKKLMIDTARPYRCICYDEEEGKFLCIDLYNDKDVVLVFSPQISVEELEALFKKEFYENSRSCDFAHALRLIEKILDQTEQDMPDSLEIGEKYRLAGRCCWALGQWDRAEEWLKKAEPIYADKSSPAQAAISFYRGLGNFYSDMGDNEKSLAAYQIEEQLAKENGSSIFQVKGDRYMREGIKMSDEERLEDAVLLFEKALEQYKQDPKGCKYAIARCGQLKGDVRAEIKKRRKSSTE